MPSKGSNRKKAPSPQPLALAHLMPLGFFLRRVPAARYKTSSSGRRAGSECNAGKGGGARGAKPALFSHACQGWEVEKWEPPRVCLGVLPQQDVPGSVGLVPASCVCVP